MTTIYVLNLKDRRKLNEHEVLPGNSPILNRTYPQMVKIDSNTISIAINRLHKNSDWGIHKLICFFFFKLYYCVFF